MLNFGSSCMASKIGCKVSKTSSRVGRCGRKPHASHPVVVVMHRRVSQQAFREPPGTSLHPFTSGVQVRAREHPTVGSSVVPPALRGQVRCLELWNDGGAG